MMNSHFGVILSDSNTTFIVTRETKVLLFTFTASMGARALAERSGILFVRSPNFFFRFFVPTMPPRGNLPFSIQNRAFQIIYIVHISTEQRLQGCYFNGPWFYLEFANCHLRFNKYLAKGFKSPAKFTLSKLN